VKWLALSKLQRQVPALLDAELGCSCVASLRQEESAAGTAIFVPYLLDFGGGLFRPCRAGSTKAEVELVVVPVTGIPGLRFSEAAYRQTSYCSP